MHSDVRFPIISDWLGDRAVAMTCGAQVITTLLPFCKTQNTRLGQGKCHIGGTGMQAGMGKNYKLYG